MVKNYVAFRRCYGYPYKVLSAKYDPKAALNKYTDLIFILLMFNRQHYILRLSAYAEFSTPDSHARTDVVSGIALLK